MVVLPTVPKIDALAEEIAIAVKEYKSIVKPSQNEMHNLKACMIKVNMDAATSQVGGSAACVARDVNSSIVGLVSRNFSCSDPAFLEAWVACLAIELVLEKNWGAVCFQGDAKAIVDAINSSQLCRLGLWHH